MVACTVFTNAVSRMHALTFTTSAPRFRTGRSLALGCGPGVGDPCCKTCVKFIVNFRGRGKKTVVGFIALSDLKGQCSKVVLITCSDAKLDETSGPFLEAF